MNSYINTTPYTINLTLGSKYWKTEYTNNFIPLNELNSSKKKTHFNKPKQIKNPFSPCKIV